MFERLRVCLRIASHFLLLLTVSNATAAAKTHAITFGKWTSVQSSANVSTGAAKEKTPAFKVRPLLLDGRVKEFTFGSLHDVTDRLFVVRRAFRVNDSLPSEPASPRWQWQRGGWVLVDRITGHISPINLPEFDTGYSEVSWYRDYAAYWGESDDGKQIVAVVAQISRRKPIVKAQPGIKLAKEGENENAPDCTCAIPEWQRDPPRVTFELNPSTKRIYVIRGHAGDLETDDQEDEEAER